MDSRSSRPAPTGWAAPSTRTPSRRISWPTHRWRPAPRTASRCSRNHRGAKLTDLARRGRADARLLLRLWRSAIPGPTRLHVRSSGRIGVREDRMAAKVIGTEENPLVHPVTGERIVFRKRSRDTGGELMEMTLYLAPRGFIAAPHVHPNQEERFEVSGAAVMFKIDGKERLYQPGEVAVVPPGTPH